MTTPPRPPSTPIPAPGRRAPDYLQPGWRPPPPRSLAGWTVEEWNAAQAAQAERRRAGRRTLGRFLCRWLVTILAGLGGGRLAEMAQLSALAHSLLGIACATFAAVVVESTTPLRPAPPAPPPPPPGLPGG